MAAVRLHLAASATGVVVADCPSPADCTDLACHFDGSGSTDDHGIVSYAWSFGDRTAGSGESVDHTYADPGTYHVTLTVTDTNDQTGTVSQDVTVTAASGGPTVHVSDLSATSATRKGGWTATVTVSTADGPGNPVSGATVTGTWSTGGSEVCTTDSNGSCSFTTNMNKKTGSATYTVVDVTASGYTYDVSHNTLDSVTVTAPT